MGRVHRVASPAATAKQRVEGWASGLNKECSVEFGIGASFWGDPCVRRSDGGGGGHFSNNNNVPINKGALG